MPAWLEAWLDWIAANPELSLLLLAVAAGIEGLFIIGLIIPGSVLMFAAGMLAAQGVLHPLATLLSAGIGALIGDVISFAIGRRGRDLLPRWDARWQILPRAERFFVRYGGMSIVLGRLIGPLRPVVPTVAGAAGYPPLRFVLIATVASALWVLAYALPGMLLGAALPVLMGLLGRLGVLLGVFLLLLWLLYRGLAAMLGAAQLFAEPLLIRTIDWSHRHRRLGRMGPALADRDQPESPVLLVCLLLLAVLAVVIEGALRLSTGVGTLAGSNLTLLDQFASLRSPVVMDIAQALRRLSEPLMLLSLTLAATLCYVIAGRRREGAHLVAGVAGAALLFAALEMLVEAPPALLSVHEATLGSIAELGTGASLAFLLAGLVATHKSRVQRLAVYWLLAAITTAATLAALILGDVLPDRALLLLGMAGLWASLVTLGFRRHQRQPRPTPLLPLAISLILCVILVPTPPHSAPQSAPMALLFTDRPDRLNLIWNGDPRPVLEAQGFRAVPSWTPASLRSWLVKNSSASTPAAPVLLNGEHPQQVWRRDRDIVRLWSVDGQGHMIDIPDDSNAGALWVGHAGQLRTLTLFGQLNIPLTTLPAWNADSAMRWLESAAAPDTVRAQWLPAKVLRVTSAMPADSGPVDDRQAQ